jgi:hypothetical protein
MSVSATVNNGSIKSTEFVLLATWLLDVEIDPNWHVCVRRFDIEEQLYERLILNVF